ncbi:hypothetical protein F2Q69_00024151 [Brassica cretica]|uniref:GOST seven transmembrane domain-containing protein n=1 Tax=Brassica cretica TaxID=69181 RepID=A0A8S9QJF3_BRACR|nr:hypothetical protein F2Q69_00024151 [Brassica cretica]
MTRIVPSVVCFHQGCYMKRNYEQHKEKDIALSETSGIQFKDLRTSKLVKEKRTDEVEREIEGCRIYEPVGGSDLHKNQTASLNVRNFAQVSVSPTLQSNPMWFESITLWRTNDASRSNGLFQAVIFEASDRNNIGGSAYGGQRSIFQYMRFSEDILPLQQHCITVLIALGLLEMVFWYLDYANFNSTGMRLGDIYAYSGEVDEENEVSVNCGIGISPRKQALIYKQCGFDGLSV